MQGLLDGLEKLVALIVGFFCYGYVALIVLFSIYGIYRNSKAKAKHDNKLKDFSLTCNRCGKLAEPITGSGNRYRCSACGNQFAHSWHGVEPYSPPPIP